MARYYTGYAVPEAICRKLSDYKSRKYVREILRSIADKLDELHSQIDASLTMFSWPGQVQICLEVYSDFTLSYSPICTYILADFLLSERTTLSDLELCFKSIPEAVNNILEEVGKVNAT